MQEQVFLLAKAILEGRGQNGDLNPIRATRVYRDDKVTIEGILDEDGQSLDAVYITLHMEPDAETNHAPETDVRFALTRSTPRSETLVYHWRESTHYLRPGRWLIYLDGIYQDIYRDYEESRQLNGKPVNDETLFPDLQWPPPQEPAEETAAPPADVPPAPEA